MGAINFALAELYPNQLVALSTAHGVRMTNCAHILAPSTSQDISSNKAYGPKVNYPLPLWCISSFTRSAMQHEYATSAWAVMCCIGGILVIDKLNGNDGHRLENVMTMEMELHSLFDSLSLWFEATVG